MKKIVYTFISFFLLQAFIQKASSQANVQLSNLDAPTKINVSLVPDKDNKRNIGGANKNWKDIYIRGILWKDGYTFLGGIYYSSNTFLGTSAGHNLITTGESTNQQNTFVGSNAGFDNTTGVYNTFLGSAAGYNNTIGGGNTFVGQGAGEDNTTGADNTFLGIQAGTRNTTGRNNIMIGEVAGGFNKTGGQNVYIGNQAGYLNSAASYNTFVGDSAGRAATSGNNTMIGSKSGTSTTSGLGNTLVGTNNTSGNTTGSYNTSLGYFTLDDNVTASGNTAIGYSTGTLFSTGSYNTFLGYDADVAGPGYSNSMALGYSCFITASNQVRIGNSTVSSIGGYENWSNISDGRFKKNIKDNVPGLDFINKLKPVTYNLDVSGIENKLSPKRETAGEAENEDLQQAMAAKEKVLQTGFVAQEVERAAKEIGYDFSGVDAPKHDNDLYSLRYAEFVVPLVKAVQELSKMNNEKDAIIERMLKRIEALERQNGIAANTNAGATEVASLKQNTPNPFSSSTIISYSLPKTSGTAKMNIIDDKGRTVKTIVLGANSGKVSVNTHGLASGNYFYELVIDGRRYGSKQMTVIK